MVSPEKHISEPWLREEPAETRPPVRIIVRRAPNGPDDGAKQHNREDAGEHHPCHEDEAVGVAEVLLQRTLHR
eukprot:7244396-Prymnesium_polylepis.3